LILFTVVLWFPALQMPCLRSSSDTWDVVANSPREGFGDYKSPISEPRNYKFRGAEIGIFPIQ